MIQRALLVVRAVGAPRVRSLQQRYAQLQGAHASLKALHDAADRDLENTKKQLTKTREVVQAEVASRQRTTSDVRACVRACVDGRG